MPPPTTAPSIVTTGAAYLIRESQAMQGAASQRRPQQPITYALQVHVQCSCLGFLLACQVQRREPPAAPAGPTALLARRRPRAELREPSLLSELEVALRPRMRDAASALRSCGAEGLDSREVPAAAAAAAGLAPGRAARRARASSGDSRAVCGLRGSKPRALVEIRLWKEAQEPGAAPSPFSHACQSRTPGQHALANKTAV